MGAAVACAILAGAFYAEEDWRGKRAWEECQRELKSQGEQLDWKSFLPAPVPDSENVFGVPEMQQWFRSGGGPWAMAGMTKGLSPQKFPGLEFGVNTPRMLVARVTIGLTTEKAAPGDAMFLRWDDAGSRKKAAEAVLTAIGPIAKAPQSPINVGFMSRKPEEVQPADIFLLCQSAPSVKDLENFLPDSILHVYGVKERVLKFETDGNGVYRVTMPVLVRPADYLAWSDPMEQVFLLVRRALERPASQQRNFSGNPDTIHGPNFLAARGFVQFLGARAQCHLMTGQPEAALNDMALVHDFSRRVLEEDKPMTLLGAMINQAIQGFYAQQIEGGLRLHVWRESELAALDAQLKSVDVLPAVREAFAIDSALTYDALESVPSAGFQKKNSLAALCPNGWGYQRLAKRVRLDFARLDAIDMGGIELYPRKAETYNEVFRMDSWSAFKFADRFNPIDFIRACQNTAYNQTAINQARVACALERYRLAHGEYPGTPAELVPQYLDQVPRDVIGGALPHYRRGTDGTFVLYSIGWNGKDNGGVPGGPPPDTKGDWMWDD